MSENMSLKKRLKNGDVVFGPWCVVPSSAVMEIIASAGFDFVIIDMEHSSISFETATDMIRASQLCHVSPIIRLGGIYEDAILKALDCGASGVLAAHVETKTDAETLMSYSRYSPEGNRGFSPYTRAGGYAGGNIKQHAETQNKETMTGVILEGKDGIENIDRILETDHLDLVYVGAYDLSQALGRPGDVTHPEVMKHLEQCIKKIRDAGIAAGGFVAKNKDDFAWMIDMGMQFITFLPDCAVIKLAMTEAVKDFIDTKIRSNQA